MQQYVGGELELFATATNWKSYFAKTLRPFIRGRVLEVGAGFGANVPYLYNECVQEWTCLEPDPELAGRIGEAIARRTLPAACEVSVGRLDDLRPAALYDTILYIDVLEHIADDRAELSKATGYLRPGGNLIVLAPAHQFLFSPFDQAVGHHRRYNRSNLLALTPPGCTVRLCRMLDAAGLIASAANATLLRAAMPSGSQIRLWDSVLVSISRLMDPAVGYFLGKSIVVVWSRDNSEEAS
jgi:SAM-dependent methyltransferase